MPLKFISASNACRLSSRSSALSTWLFLSVWPALDANASESTKPLLMPKSIRWRLYRLWYAGCAQCPGSMGMVGVTKWCPILGKGMGVSTGLLYASNPTV